MSRLKHKVALITGAARGIGAAIAEAFVREGAHVIATDLDEAGGAATAARLKAAWLRLDVREELGWIGVMARVLDSHGRLDVLVNNAGITGLEAGAVHDPEHASLDDWRAVHRTNLDGVFLGCKHGIRAMRRGHAAPRDGQTGPARRALARGTDRTGAAARGGSIINLSSRAGVVGIPAAAAYASSKSAVRNHSKSVALYCAEQGLPIRCNSIHPAAILTPMWDPLLGSGPERETRMAACAADTPLQRFGTPEEVAALAVFLASDESAYVTGAEFHVDGGILAGSAGAPRGRS